MSNMTYGKKKKTTIQVFLVFSIIKIWLYFFYFLIRHSKLNLRRWKNCTYGKMFFTARQSWLWTLWPMYFLKFREINEDSFEILILLLLSFPLILLKNINFKIFLLLLLFISHQHFFYYFINKKLTTIQFFFSYKLIQLYITSILFFNY